MANRKVAEKPKNSKQTLLRLWGYLYDSKGLLFLAAFLMMASNLFALVGPLLSGYAIDAIQLGPGKVLFDKVFFYCGLMLVFYSASSVLSYVISLLMIRLSQRVVATMRKHIFDKITELPIGYFDRVATGDIISRVSYDVDTINTSLASDAIQVLSSIVTIVGSFAMMLLISPVLVLIFVVTVPASVLLTRYLMGKFQPLFSRRSRKLGELNGFVEEIISGQQTIKLYNQEEAIIERFDEKNQDAVDAYYNAEYYGSMTGPSINFINNISLSLISIFGALLFLFGHLSLGNVSSFVLYSRKFSGPINELANIFSDLQSALAAAERIFRLLDEAPEVSDVPDAYVFKEVAGEVALNHVSFGYQRNRPIIRDVSLTVPPGSLVAIVGPTGAGKTTIVNLLMRFYDPDSGEIRLDGHDIRQATRKSLRGSYAMVLQDTWLFTGTIFENLAYGKADATLAQVEAAAKAAHIHDFIDRLPHKYQTIISEDGAGISQGQKQLLTIARAMLLDADLLILDEATSNVDTQTELLIQSAMTELMQGKTSFVIAHRLSTIRHADLILVVEQGNIVEQGTHDALLQKGGRYAALYQAQFEQ
ncbi:ABC transporter ATP-binding protein [Enterococcus sp. RIT-PI-f]|uniref:ABC transporter ATP-binding protein n=1 Tax=Enterococcus sp. RIT-PI-f TaxID=1690244 RepID=UPI0006B9CB64|nr:ABC transporter ATP-binding protein [Enterococcus sp. RIT-PI-f]KPG68869.1 ABC transporter [Enterococcus sp. RIT-PI-f]